MIGRQAERKIMNVIWTVVIFLWVAMVVLFFFAKPVHCQEFLSTKNQIKSEVDRVQIPVTVTDTQGRLIGGLKSGNFRIFEDNEEQEILSCSVDDAPVSIAIVFDNSGSMAPKANLSRNMLKTFVENSNKQDEYSLIVFSDVAQVYADWTNSENILQSVLAAHEEKGRTALLDAIYLAVGQMRTASNARRVVLVLTDGGDNHSRYTEHDIKQAFKETDIQFYGIGLFTSNPFNVNDLRNFPTQEERMGPELLAELGEMTGGLSFAVAPDNTGMYNGKMLNDLAEHISRSIRDQYTLTYRPRQSKIHDGRYHKLKVRVVVPRGYHGYLIPYTRNGYKGAAE